MIVEIRIPVDDELLATKFADLTAEIVADGGVVEETDTPMAFLQDKVRELKDEIESNLSYDRYYGKVETEIHTDSAHALEEKRGLWPVHLDAKQVVEILRDMAKGVETGDTYEGSIEFLIPSRVMDRISEDEFVEMPPEERQHWRPTSESGVVWQLNPSALDVRGSYRIGNSMGQGTVRLIGEIREPEPEPAGG